jgi:Dolichyl-phosphate-mannose-protein mannosyltransferase
MNPAPLEARSRRHLYVLLVVACVIRIATMLHFHTYSGAGPEAWGFETGMISKSLAEGHGFASPFGGNTGPTAWFPPLHPAIQALIFKIFGIQSTASAVVMRLFDVACTLGALLFLFRICRRLWGEEFAFLATWAWALYPRAIWFDVTLISYAVLSVLLLLAALDLALSFESSNTLDWVRQGVLWGMIALANPSLLSLLPICWLATALRTGFGKKELRGFAISALLSVALVLPWSVRNYVTFHAWIPVRGNMGHELYKGNRYGATGDQDYALNPWNNPAELREYIRLGERGYVIEHKRLAMQFIHQNPAGAFRLFRRRIFLFWDLSHPPMTFGVNENLNGSLYFWVGILGLVGLAVAFFIERKQRGMFSKQAGWYRVVPQHRTTWLFAAVVLVYPLPYYITFPLDRYRLIIEPILLIYALHLLTGFRAFRTEPAADSAAQVMQAV